MATGRINQVVMESKLGTLPLTEAPPYTQGTTAWQSPSLSLHNNTSHLLHQKLSHNRDQAGLLSPMVICTTDLKSDRQASASTENHTATSHYPALSHWYQLSLGKWNEFDIK